MTDQINNTYNIIGEKISSWWDISIQMLPNLIVALLIILLFKYIANLTKSGFERYFSNRFDSKTIAQLIGFFIKIGLITLGLVIALSILGLDKALVSILAGAGVAGLAIGFALQDIVQNLISGILLGINKPFRLGDTIEVSGITGKAKQLTLKHTVLQQPNGITVTVPNTEVFQGSVRNFTHSKERRIQLTVGVGYDSDLDKARSILQNAISSLPCLKKNKDVTVFASELADSSINFTIRYWIDLTSNTTNLADATHDGINAIHLSLTQANIDIPFPIRTILK